MTKVQMIVTEFSKPCEEEKGIVIPDKIANKRFDGSKLCAHVCESMKEACRLMDYYIENGKLEIKAVDKARMEIHYLNGTTHVFMNEWKYSSWCIGRTYWAA